MPPTPLPTFAYLGTSRQALYALRHKGEGPPCYRLGRRLLFRLSEVDEWLARQRDRQQQPA
jgi:excisionase family DNA binding protein